MSPLGLNRRRIAVTAAYNLPHVILNARRNQGYPLPRQVSSPRAVALPNALLIAAAFDTSSRPPEKGRRGDVCGILFFFATMRNFYFPEPRLMLLYYHLLYSLCKKKSQSKQEKPFSVFFFPTLSLYLLQLLSLHYSFLIFFMHCPRGIFSPLPSRRCSFSNFCSAPSVAVGLSLFHAQVYGHIEKQIRALPIGKNHSPANVIHRVAFYF